MAILKIRDAEGNVQEILAIKGEDGKDYVLTDADKQEIANIVASMGGNPNAPAVDLSNYYTKSETDTAITNAVKGIKIPDTSAFLTEAQVLALIQANMPASAEGVSY